MYTIFNPNNKDDFDKYLILRWRILRFPWGGKRGSEIDDFENVAIHRAIKDSNGNMVGVGRIHFINQSAQIRYMAIKKIYRGEGLGTKMLSELEKIALTNKTKKIFLNSRENVTTFYRKNGYTVVGKADFSFRGIIHYKMEKKLNN
tara:strand:- start:875 stop:1312 length:438 start_codon:yes stop_codon:yes gene_type:complete